MEKKFIKSPQFVTFINNKWWVWKTTISYNVANYLADNWYKVLIVDSDPQCNMTLLSLWVNKYSELWLFENSTIYNIVKPQIEWKWDIDFSIKPVKLTDNLDILPGNQQFTNYDDILNTSYSEAITNVIRWFTGISWLSRYINELAIKEKYDIVIFDVSPSLVGSINKTIFLMSDFFVLVSNPDLFSEQWAMNLWEKASRRKDQWSSISQIAKRESSSVPASHLLKWNPLFLWYIINSFKIYAEQPISDQRIWIENIKPKINKFLSQEHTVNWLWEVSYSQPLWTTQDYWRLPSIWQREHKPLYKITNSEVRNTIWSIEVLEQCKKDMEDLCKNIVDRLSKRGK